MRKGVFRREDDWIPDIADADVVVDYVFYKAASTRIALDAYSIVRTIDGEVGDAHGVDAAAGFASNRHSVPRIKMIVGNSDVRCGAQPSCFNGDAIVAGADVGVKDRNVARGGGIDAVRVASRGGGVDLDAPRREAVRLFNRDMKVGRVAQSDAIESEVVRLANNEHTSAVLLRVIDLGDVSEIPPRSCLTEERCTAAAVNSAVAHDRAMRRVIGDDKRFASVTVLIDDPATAGADVKVARIA